MNLLQVFVLVASVIVAFMTGRALGTRQAIDRMFEIMDEVIQVKTEGDDGQTDDDQ